MALTTSNPFPLGTSAPDFRLTDTRNDQPVSLEDLHSEKGTVIMFLCNHCPYVKHINKQLVQLVKEYQELGVAFAGISSNDVGAYPQDGPGEMAVVARNKGYTFPYLYDESQAVARAYDAACTPEFYVFNPELKLVYHGQMDDARPGNDIPVSGKDLRTVLDLLIAGKPIPEKQKPGIGCGIKWKS